MRIPITEALAMKTSAANNFLLFLQKIFSDSGTEIQNLAKPGIFPNPVRDHFKLRGADGSPLTLFDASGRIVKQLDHYQEGNDISSADLQPGIYVLKIGSAKSAVFLRLMKR